MKSINSEKQDDMITLYNVETKKFEDVQRIIKTEEEWKEILTAAQFHITRDEGTEPSFSYEGLHSTKKGVYQCVCCGSDLFLSVHKYDSKTGWPSFWKPVAEENIETQIDNSLFMKRIEVHCPRCGCHLGHIFPDGPDPTGQRYCINGAALKFKEMKEEK